MVRRGERKGDEADSVTWIDKTTYTYRVVEGSSEFLFDGTYFIDVEILFLVFTECANPCPTRRQISLRNS